MFVADASAGSVWEASVGVVDALPADERLCEAIFVGLDVLARGGATAGVL